MRPAAADRGPRARSGRRPRAQGAAHDRHRVHAGRARRRRSPNGTSCCACACRNGTPASSRRAIPSASMRRSSANPSRASAPSGSSIRRSRMAASSPTPTVEGLGDYFVSERIRVWVSAGERTAFVVPARFRHDALRRRLRARCAGLTAAMWTCPCSAGASAPTRPSGRHRNPVRPQARRPTGARCREARTVRPPDPGDHPLAADAAVPARGARRRPDRPPRHSSRGGAADQRADGRHLRCAPTG